MISRVFCISLLLATSVLAQSEFDVIFALNRGNEFKKAGRLPDAEKEYARGLELSVRLHGEEHKNTGMLLVAQGDLYEKMTKFAEAEKAYERFVKVQEKLKGPEDLETASAIVSHANVSLELGKFEQSEKLLRRALAIREKAKGEDSAEVADTLNELAVLASRQGKHEDAERLYRNSLIIRQKTDGPDSAVVAQSLSNLGLTLHELDRHKDAEDCHRRALEIREKVKGADNPITAESLNNLGLLLRDMGRYAEADQVQRRALTIRETYLGVDHARTVATVTSLAILNSDQGKYVEAAGWFHRALASYERANGPEHPTVSDMLGSLGLLEKVRGRNFEAERLLRESLAIAEKVYGPENEAIVAKLNHLAAFYKERERFAESEALYRRSLAIFEKSRGKDHPAISACLTDLASLAADRGKLPEAIEYLERSLKIREKAYGLEHPAVVDGVNSLAALASKAGDRKLAESLYRRNVTLMEKLFGPAHPAYAEVAFSLAEFHAKIGRHAEAEAGFRQALEIYEKTLGSPHPNVANTLAVLGNSVRSQGKPEAAREIHQHSREMNQKIFGLDHPSVSANLDQLALDAWQDGKTKDATTFFDDQRRSARRYLLREFPFLTASEQQEFAIKSDGETFARALSFARDHATEGDLARRSAEWVLNGKHAVHEARTLKARLDRDLADPEMRKALAEVQDLRVRETALLAQEGGPATMNARKQRAELRFRRKLLEQSLGNSTAALFPHWVELDEVRSAVPAGSLLIEFVKFHPARMNARPDEPAWDRSRYVAWVIPSIGPVSVVDLGESAPIDAAIQTARQEIADGVRIARALGEAPAEKKLRELLDKLGERVLKPFATQLKGVKNLLLCPDGDLWLLPWAAMPMEDDKYLVEVMTPRLLTSGRELVKPSNFKGDTAAPLVVADPAFDASPVAGVPQVAGTEAKGRLANFEATLVFGPVGKFTVRIPEGETIGQGTWKQDGTLVVMDTEKSHYVGRITGRELRGERRLKEKSGTPADPFVVQLAEFATTPLPMNAPQKAGPLSATRKQGETATAILKELTNSEAISLSDVKATEAAVKSAVRPRILILATHSFQSPSTGLANDNPFTRSGLLLAGSNKRNEALMGQEDGVLTSDEIATLDLRGTRLVVVNCCEVTEASDAVAALRHAFRMAGSSSVLATLWSSTDAESTRLLNRFYTQLAKDENPCLALANVQRETIQIRRKANGAAHPFSWAAFTITGQ